MSLEIQLSSWLDYIVGSLDIRSFPDEFRSIREYALALVICYSLKDKDLIGSPDVLDVIRTDKSSWENLSLVDLTFWNSNLDELIKKDIIGSWYQHSLDSDYRKSSASNYTVGSHRFLSKLNVSYDEIEIVCDPFCGSARLITSIIPLCDKIETVVINDISTAAVLISYLRIIYLYSDIEVIASIGNAFDKLEMKVDVIIMNPPFTRTMHISDEVKASTAKYTSIKGQGHGGLHIFALFLADSLLNDNGMIISVIPASTIASTYSKPVQQLILSKYDDIEFLQDHDKIAFSQDSDFNELILVMTKASPDSDIMFRYFSGDSMNINRDQLKNDWNWMRYFRNFSLLRMRGYIMDNFGVRSGYSINLDIKRGVELYGPDFFFFPNKIYTSLEFEADRVKLIGDDTVYLPSYLLKPIFRKPGIYQRYISPEINEYTLSVPETYTDKLLSDYIDKHKDQAGSAINKFGDNWVSHIHNQIIKKNPRGYLFVVDKTDIRSVSSFIHFKSDQYLCTKNFYVISGDFDSIKLLAAWMNSTWFLVLYLSSRREINKSYGRMQIIDYLNENLFPDFLFMNDTMNILAHFDTYRSTAQPAIIDQLLSDNRMKLDKLFAEYFDIDYDVIDLNKLVLDILNEFN